jgi:hypothetical protein
MQKHFKVAKMFRTCLKKFCEFPPSSQKYLFGVVGEAFDRGIKFRNLEQSLVLYPNNVK